MFIVFLEGNGITFLPYIHPIVHPSIHFIHPSIYLDWFSLVEYGRAFTWQRMGSGSNPRLAHHSCHSYVRSLHTNVGSISDLKFMTLQKNS